MEPPHLGGDEARQPLRRWFPSFAYVMSKALRPIALADTGSADASRDIATPRASNACVAGRESRTGGT